MKNLSRFKELEELEEKIDGYIKLNRFIIETHSEYFIRKLQYLTASPKSEMKSEDTAIYYFYPPKAIPPGYPQVQKIEISKGGGLSHDFGSGFFDEADNISLSIWSLNTNRN
jgi:predicted ATPase